MIVEESIRETAENSPPTPVDRAETPVARALRKVTHRPDDDPRWARPAVIALLGATAVLYLWGLSASGWANSFYSAAAQAGSASWKAFLFGSSDAANSITVDKTPLSLWPMALAVRIFGPNSWSILVPQAIEGVAAVGLLYLTVKRRFGAAAGLLAGAILATTPVAVLMFRFNNPDALLVLLMVAAAYFLTRAVEDGRTKWMVASGAMIGLAFLTKELQAFVIVPVLVGTYLIAGPPRLLRRLVQSVWFGLSMLATCGWWVAIVSLWPASSRPWFGGSQDNTFWNVLFGYNGLGRLTGNETGSVGGGGQGGTGNWGETGLTRMFNSSFGGQASWLIPAALFVVVVGLAWTMRRARTDQVRAGVLLWGGWLVLTALVFSLSQGIIHEYYTVALAPAIGALVGAGAVEAWRRRREFKARALMSVGVALSAAWSFVLLTRTPQWVPWLRWGVVAGGAVGVMGLLAGGWLATLVGGGRRQLSTAGAIALLTVSLAGPLAFSLNTAATAHSGALPTAGPAGRSGNGPGRGFGARGGFTPGGPFAGGGAATSTGGFRAGPGGFPAGGPPGGGGMPGAPPQLGNRSSSSTANSNRASATGGANDFSPPTQGGGGGSRTGGLLDASDPGDELIALLEKDADDFDWVAATIGANSAAGYQLATEQPVMPIGGFNGSDPSPTLEQFQQYVAEGRIHFFIAGGMGGGPGRSSSGTGSTISAWVQQNFTVTTVDGATVYDLTNPST